MLRTMYKVVVSKKENPTDVKTFYMTGWLQYKTCYLSHRFNYYACERINIYGVPADIKLITREEAENYFNIVINK